MDIDILKELLEYNPNTGIFTWKVSRGGKKKGSKAGSKCIRNGYISIQINGSNYKASRLAWLYMTGQLPKDQIDHKNRIRDDNRWDNLQDINNWENQQNKNTCSKSGVPGVSWSEKNQKWIVRLTIKGKRKYLGYYVDLEKACKVRKDAEVRYAAELGTL